MNLSAIGDHLRLQLDDKYRAREAALPLCRSAIRFSANAIRAVHRQESEAAAGLMEQARACLKDADAAMSAHPDIRSAGFFHDAAKEYAEARITAALVFGTKFPGPRELETDPAAYLNGMGEAVGEIRRHILDLMRRGELSRSEELLERIDEIFYLLTSIDYPDAMTGGLRRTTDVARSLIERTRGDLSTTIIQQRLIGTLEQAADPADRRRG